MSHSNETNRNGLMRAVRDSQSGANNEYTLSTNDTVLNKELNILTSRSPNIQTSQRSNIVKDVEKWKKIREERQAGQKTEKEEFLPFAPGHPHWNLLNLLLKFRQDLDTKPLTEHGDHQITVYVRKRPLNKREAERKEVDIIKIASKNQLIVHQPKNRARQTKPLENKLFNFDYVFDETDSNEMVYRYTAQPLIKTIFDGGYATCLAYGPTGSGKTYTMGGNFIGKNQDCQTGLYAMVASDVFKLANSSIYRNLGLVVWVSFFEVYAGKTYNLSSNKQRFRMFEDGKQQVQIVGLAESIVYNTDAVLEFIQRRNQWRTSGRTSANSNSSLSHAVFQIYLKSRNTLQIHGKFSLIDFIGNDKEIDMLVANRPKRKEACGDRGKKSFHLAFPFKLSQVLRHAFGGANSRTCIIAMVSPGINSREHTLNTLRYVDRLKKLAGGNLQTNSCDEDLLKFVSSNETNMTPELLHVHQVVTEVKVAKQKMLDTHKQIIEEVLTTYEKIGLLLRSSEKVTFDQEKYCKQWEDLVNHATKYLVRSKEVIANYKAKMLVEKQLKRKAKRK